MAELTISSDEIRGALERYVSSYIPDISREEVGIVTEAGDGIARVEGLPSTMANELLEFADGTLGVSLNLDVREIGVVVLEEHGALEYTTIVASPASDPAGFKYLAPYAGSAIGQHWMYAGKHVLIVFDDLSKQAEAYRAVSLLLRRPPGREAYPGDVFYLHSRLLERCAKLSDDLGGGSMTGLPIIETKANDISAYIPTNVISITDGQIFLETDLFNAGVRPAVNVGISVSRVGGSAQVKAMKQVAGGLKLALSQYRDLEAFASFASDLDAVSRAQLDRGGRLVELLKQPQYSPLAVDQQVVTVWAGTSGLLDDVPLEDIRRFEREFLDQLRRDKSGILDAIRETGELSDDTVTALKDAMEEFRRGFETGSGDMLVVDEDPV